MANDLATSRRTAVDAFLTRNRQEQAAGRGRGRLIFGLDATGSRKRTWDRAGAWQAGMIAEAAKIGRLEIQIACYSGASKFEYSNWTNNSRELTDWASRIKCEVGGTQIRRFLEHVGKEHKQRPISAAIFVGDMCEEDPSTLYDAVAGLSPLFVFQENDDSDAEKVLRELARLTGGQYFKFTADSWRDVAELLREIAVYAVGGVKALENRNTDSARKLLGQLRKKDEKK